MNTTLFSFARVDGPPADTWVSSTLNRQLHLEPDSRRRTRPGFCRQMTSLPAAMERFFHRFHGSRPCFPNAVPTMASCGRAILSPWNRLERLDQMVVDGSLTPAC